MECAKSSITCRNNLIAAETLQKRADRVFRTITSAVINTLGPYGSTTIIEDSMKKHKITKDGYTVIKSLLFSENLERTIFELLLKISRKLVRTVGDGSTSAMVIAYDLYRGFLDDKILQDVSSKVLLTILDEIVKELEVKLRERSKPISDDMHELKYIASVSCNNDDNYGDLICEIFNKIGRYGFINLELSPTSETFYEIKNGYEIKRGFISSLMVNQPDKRTAILTKPKVLMVEGFLDTDDMDNMAEFLGQIAMQAGQPIVVVASGYSSDMITFFHMNRANAVKQNKDELFSVVAVDMPSISVSDKAIFDDLAINLGAKPIRKKEGEKFSDLSVSDILQSCGSCEIFKSDDMTTKFIDGLGDKDKKDARIEEIKKEIKLLIKDENLFLHDMRIYDLKKRMALLENHMSTLYIGGNTEESKESIKYLLEDAISACKSALRNGVIIGGNLSIPFILSDKNNVDGIVKKVYERTKMWSIVNEENISAILNVINKGFEMSFLNVLLNYRSDIEEMEKILKNCIEHKNIYNLKTMAYELDGETSIINSVETDIEILKGAVSIISLIISSNQFIQLSI